MQITQEELEKTWSGVLQGFDDTSGAGSGVVAPSGRAGENADGGDGVGVEELSQLSRSVSGVLDEHDPIPGRYTLEVSTPGVERRLRNESHFSGAIGETVNLRTTPEPDGRRRLVGTLVSVEGETLTIEDVNSGVTEVHMDQIEKARTVFEWGPAPKPGSQVGPKGSKHNHKGGSRS